MRFIPQLHGGYLVALTVLSPCCDGEVVQDKRTLDASVIVMGQPESLGLEQRPPVEFPHKRHADALKREGCPTCHVVDDQKRIRNELEGLEVKQDPELLTDEYHRICIDCHQERLDQGDKAGPTDCGGCHVPRRRGVASRQMPRFDYSLHYRHLRAEEEKCQTCHHVYNEKKKVLEYAKGKENACRDCHGERDEGKNLSLRHASHVACINCHIEKLNLPNPKGLKIGPVDCNGCHDKQELAAVKSVENPPRLKRGQPDLTWIKAPDKSAAGRVAFSHVFHEKQTTACSDCHHGSLEPCMKCHTVNGTKDGAGITLEQAYHSPDSGYSCVGCHEKKTSNPECASCHHMLGSPPHKSSCKNCHIGPPPVSTPELGQPNEIAEILLEPLPQESKDFPKELVIDELAKKYKPSKLPHLKIVQKLDEIVRKSRLATRFHARADVTCTGCHHLSPPEVRQPPCQSCHATRPHPLEDEPGLMAALHRQCIGCHEQMAIKKALGCEDCHAKESMEDGQ